MIKKIIFLLVSFLVFWTIFTYPSIWHLTDKIIGDGGDNYQFLAFQNLAYREFSAGQFPFGWSDYWRYPVGFNFGTSYDSALLLISGLVLYPIFSDPVLVYNLTIIVLFLLNYIFSYLFFGKIFKEGFLGIIGALIYGFSFYNIARSGGHPNLLLTGFIPFFLYSLIILKERLADKKSLFLFILSVSFIYLSSLQYLLIFIGATVFLIPIFYIYKKEVVREYWDFMVKKKWTLSLAVLVIVAIFLAFNGQKIGDMLSGRLVYPTAEIVSVPIVNFISPNLYIRTFAGLAANDTKEWIEYAVFFGFMEFFFFLLFLFSNLEKRFKIYILSSIAVLFVLAIGDQGTNSYIFPYKILFSVMPYRGIIEPARFYIFIYLFITLGILSYLKSLVFYKSKFAWIAGILLLGVTLERIPFNYYLSDNIARVPFVKIVQKSPGKAVLDLPLFIDWWNGNRYDLYSVYYNKPTVNGYIHWSGNNETTLSFINDNKLRTFECNDGTANLAVNTMVDNNRLYSALKKYGINIIVIHKDLYAVEKCNTALEHINDFLNAIDKKKVYEDKDKVIFNL